MFSDSADDLVLRLRFQSRELVLNVLYISKCTAVCSEQSVYDWRFQ